MSGIHELVRVRLQHSPDGSCVCLEQTLEQANTPALDRAGVFVGHNSHDYARLRPRFLVPSAESRPTSSSTIAGSRVRSFIWTAERRLPSRPEPRPAPRPGTLLGRPQAPS